MALGFGDCVFNTETREISRGGKTLHLQPKVFRLLEILVDRRPNAVSKEELIGLLWPKTFVAEGNLARLVTELREAIGDGAHESRFVRTVHGFGYAFHGQATLTLSDRPVFKLIWGDREIALQPGVNLLGRDPLAIACIDVASVSRHHARITVTGDEAAIEDLGSKNGTYVESRRLEGPAELHDGDALRLGSVPLTFRRFGAGGTTQTARTGEGRPRQ